MSDWRATFPSAAAADHIRAWLDDRVSEIERGEVAQARRALEDPGWRINFDLTGVPLNALARVDGFVEAACDALADRSLQPDKAVEEIRRARRVVTPEVP